MFYLGPYKRGFLTLEHIYLEPMVSIGQVRIMIFLNQKVSVYDSCAVGRRGGGAASTSPLMAPQYLDKSW